MRNARWLFLSLALVTGLAACKPPEEGAQSIRSRALVMTTPWENLSIAETRVSILGDDPVVARRAQWEPVKNVYKEAMQTGNGVLQFERRKRVPKGQALPAAEELAKRYGSGKAAKEAGLKLDQANIRTVSIDSGEVAYVVGQDKLACAIFFLYSKESFFEPRDGIEPQYQALHGTACEKPGSSKAQALEADIVDLASRVRFDEGRFSRTKIFAQALQILREKPLEEELEPATVDATDREPPLVAIPASLTVEQPVATVEGVIRDRSPIEEARLGERWLHIEPDGRFRARLPVAMGTNKLVLEAKDQLGNAARREIVIQRTGGQPDARPLAQKAGRFYALVIGVKAYQAPIPSLDTPVADAVELSRILENQYGYEVIPLIDVGKQDIVDALKELQRKLTIDDNLLIYYAGHGVLDPETDRGYWLPADARADSPDNWISNAYVSRLIRDMPARHVVVVADACYSGSLAREQDLLAGGRDVDPEQTIFRRSRTTFSSGELEEVLDEGGGNHSLFAMHFLNTLKGNAAVSSGIGISGAVQKLVRNDAAQTPQYGAILSAGHDQGSDFLFISRSTRPAS